MNISVQEEGTRTHHIVYRFSVWSCWWGWTNGFNQYPELHYEFSDKYGRFHRRVWRQWQYWNSYQYVPENLRPMEDWKPQHEGNKASRFLYPQPDESDHQILQEDFLCDMDIIQQGAVYSHVRCYLSFWDFFKCVRNCGVSPKGPRSDHSAVQLYFMNWSIKYKSKFIKRTVMDWKAIK